MNHNSSRASAVQKLVLLALFTTISLAIYIIESWLPPLAPIPGIKLGLANVITLILLIHLSPKDAAAVLLTRIIMAGIFGGNLFGFTYSLIAGIAAFAVMASANALFQKHYIILTAIMGAIIHNIAQLIVALAITRVPALWAYLPLLILSGTACGLFTGCCAAFSRKPLAKIFRAFTQE